MFLRRGRSSREGEKFRIAFDLTAVFVFSVLIMAAVTVSAQSAHERRVLNVDAILDTDSPDQAKIATEKQLAAQAEPLNLTDLERARFLYKRALARWDLGRANDAIADCEAAIEAADSASLDPYDYQTVLLRFFSQIGVPGRSAKLLRDMMQRNRAPELRWRLFSIYRHAVIHAIREGRVAEADGYFARSEEIMNEATASGVPLPPAKRWILEDARSRISEIHGDLEAAEQDAERTTKLLRAAIEQQAKQNENYNLRNSQEFMADLSLLRTAQIKMRQGLVSEAEVDLRRALLGRLRSVGKYNAEIPIFVVSLARNIAAQRRFSEAERLYSIAIEVDRTLGVERQSTRHLTALLALAEVLSLQEKWQETAGVFSEIEVIVEQLPEPVKERYLLNVPRIRSLYECGKINLGVELARRVVARWTTLYGAEHQDTAVARGLLAVGLAQTDPTAADREFRAAIPILSAHSVEMDQDGATLLLDQSRREILEAYLSFLSRASGNPSDAALNEGFGLADQVRGSIVQKALLKSAARISTSDVGLSSLVRRAQDIDIRLGNQLELTSHLLSLPISERDQRALDAADDLVRRLQAERGALRSAIQRQFPAYSALVQPSPPTIDDIRASLRNDEVMVAVYCGRRSSFEWVISRSGRVGFFKLDASRQRIRSLVHSIRTPFDASVEFASDILPFDLRSAYELYQIVLEPSEQHWKAYKTLVLVTNGELGQLPIALLPTSRPATVHPGGPLFSEYRDIPWLVRTHASYMLPSAAAFQSLRRLPPGPPSRKPLLAFGDPIFSINSEDPHSIPATDLNSGAECCSGRATAPLSEGPDLSSLAPLPDTADELAAIAEALHSSPAVSIRTGQDANERAVKTADLTDYKVLAFATHGLAAGELRGLTEPALALTPVGRTNSAPEEDGLLTASEIASLKLDADWVVLSACNTAAGANDEAEVASGLARAFFYAGTRAVLVTNWPVNSVSSRMLVSDLFRRQSSDRSLTRAEALRQAAEQLIDGSGFTDSGGKTLFWYAHPLFWAPYSIIGDGGQQ